MDIIICCFYIVTSLYLENVIIKMRKYRNLLTRDKINKEDIIQIVYKTGAVRKDVKFQKGKFYAYNALNKEIRYEEKEIYSNYDLFCLNHEIGHLQDDNSNRIFFFSIMKGIERMVFLPLYILSIALTFLYSSVFQVIVLIIGIVLLIFAFFQLYFICKYEKSASVYALSAINKIDINIYEKFSDVCLKQQFLMELLEVQIVLFWLIIVG